MLNFHRLAVTTSIVCAALAAVWLLAPRLLLSLWAVPDTGPVELMGRRGAALFLGIGVMFHGARNATAGTARDALARGITVGCTALAGLGVFEMAVGHAGIGMAFAVVVELLIAAGFARSGDR